MNICIYKYNFSTFFKNQSNINKVALPSIQSIWNMQFFFLISLTTPCFWILRFFFHIRYNVATLQRFNPPPHHLAPFFGLHIHTHRSFFFLFLSLHQHKQSKINNKKYILSQPTGAPQQLHPPLSLSTPPPFNWEAASPTLSSEREVQVLSSGFMESSCANFQNPPPLKGVAPPPFPAVIRKTHLSKFVTRIINTFNMREVERDLQPLNQLQLFRKMNVFFSFFVQFFFNFLNVWCLRDNVL